MLKYTNKRIIELQDWDNLVTETYNKPYSFQQQDGCKDRGSYNFVVPSKYGIEDYKNNTLPFEINGGEMGISFETWLNTSVEDINKDNPESYPGQNNLFWDRNFYPHELILIDDLYKKGLIEEGEYTINIDW